MTKYILSGGGDIQSETFGQELSKEIFKTVNKPVKILSCFFALPEDEWNASLEEYLNWFKKYFGGDSQITLARIENFKTQVESTDILYFHGGDDELLLKVVNKIPNFKQLISIPKIVIGSSAGAIMLSTLSWCCDRRANERGVGAVPIKVLVHYGSNYGYETSQGPIDWKKAEQDMKDAPGDLPILKIREGEFAVC